jgi:dTDP-4-dehydrorhamnose reductase
MVAGGNGQVGKCLIDRLKRSDLAWEAHGRATLDIADERSVAEHLQRFKPSVLINAAAYTSVDKAEMEPDVAARANIKGPATLAKLCQEHGCSILHISTDYVFSGDASVPYTPDDPVGPSGVYGATKLEGEYRIQDACPNHVIIRTAWVFSEHGNNFMKTMLRLASERDKLQVVDDQQGTPTYAGHIADALLSIAHQVGAADDSDLFGLYHFGGNNPITWCGFARYILEVALERGFISKLPRVNGITTADFPTPARRPSYSVLDSTLLKSRFGIDPSNWQAGVQNSLDALMGAKAVHSNENSSQVTA